MSKMSKLRISSLQLENVSRFKNAIVSFTDRLNVICGTNGIGKTTILDVIASSFVVRNQLEIRTRADSAIKGRLELAFTADNIPHVIEGRINTQTIVDQAQPFGLDGFGQQLLYIKTGRDFTYSKSEAVTRDPTRSMIDMERQALRGVPAQDIKLWLANRYLFKHHGHDWPPHRHANLDLAIKAFERLDDRFALDRVDTSTFDVMVRTPAGIIPYEFLSSGFRAIYAMILGIIKEIEYRPLQTAAVDFAGVILIDEVELHLHPTWQRAVVSVLKDIFKSAQIIVTTHSPHVVQSCDNDEVISLVDTQDGPAVRSLATGPFGYKGWTLEEILEDVMGLEDVSSPELRQAIHDFDTAIDQDDTRSVQSSLKVLEQMLHPTSHMRKLLRLQAAPYLGDTL